MLKRILIASNEVVRCMGLNDGLFLRAEREALTVQ